MVSHLGHLVHRPSGISRFFFLLAPSLGFLTKAVSEPVGGGLSAGSVGSTVPGGFFVNKVAAIAGLGAAAAAAAQDLAAEGRRLAALRDRLETQLTAAFPQTNAAHRFG